jgi:hypothetical protein
VIGDWSRSPAICAAISSIYFLGMRSRNLWISIGGSFSGLASGQLAGTFPASHQDSPKPKIPKKLGSTA